MSQEVQKNMIRLLLIRIPTSIFTLLYFVLLTRLLGPDQFGGFRFLQTNIQFFILIFGLNSGIGIAYFISNSNFLQSSIIKLAASLLIIGIVAVWLLTYLSGSLPSLRDFLIPSSWTERFWSVFLIFSFVAQQGAAMLEGFIKGSGGFSSYNKGTFWAAVIATLAYGIGYAVFDSETEAVWKFLVILCVQWASFSYLALLWVKQEKRSKKPSKKQQKVSLKSYWSHIRFGYGGHLVRFLNKRFDVWIVQSIHGTMQLGFYQLSVSFNQFVLDAIQPSNQLLMKHIHPGSEEIGLYTRHVRILSFGVALGSIVLILLFPWLIPSLFGNEFSEAIRPAQILSVTTYFVFLTNSLSLFNYTHNKLSYTFYAQILGLIVVLALDFLWIPTFGIEGAAWASLISYAITGLYMLWKVPSFVGVSRRTLLLPSLNDVKAFWGN